MATTTTKEQAMKNLIEEAVAADIAAADALATHSWTPAHSIRYERAILALMQATGNSKAVTENYVEGLVVKVAA
jgi:hypothetical protein